MNIKIDAVEGISLTDQLKIVSDYIELFFGKPKETKKGTGLKIDSCGRRYHVSCKKTPTQWSFKIWWAV